MSKTLNLTEAKARLSELVTMVSSTHEHVEITRNGELAAVLVSCEELDALRETVAILSDPQMITDIAEANADWAAGRVTKAESVRRAMVARRRVVAGD